MAFTNWMRTAVSLSFLFFGAACSHQEVSFSRDVNPILQKNCSECHTAGGKGIQVSGFSVESYASIMKGTKFGPVIDPGSSVSSTMGRLISHKADPSINMPQGRPQMPKASLDTIAAWIDQGAKDN